MDITEQIEVARRAQEDALTACLRRTVADVAARLGIESGAVTVTFDGVGWYVTASVAAKKSRTGAAVRVNSTADIDGDIRSQLAAAADSVVARVTDGRAAGRYR